MRRSVVASLFLIFSLLVPQALAQEGTFDLEKTKRVLEEEIQKQLDRGVASVSIALVRDGKIVWEAAFGYMNVAMQVPATPETIYVVGSTFKAATATALLQLAEQGKFALDDAINDYLGDSKVQDLADSPVTFRHILCHGSGLQAGANTVDVWSRTLPDSLEELTVKLKSVRPPMEKWEYNNYAYGLAGLLVERISGQPYEEYIREHVLKPLGIETPGPVSPTPAMLGYLALPYVVGPGSKPQPVSRTRYDVYPAGDIYLTASDMARFLGAHLQEGEWQGQRLISAESTREAHRVQFQGYGLGWGVSGGPGQRLISHGGGVLGFATQMLGDLDARVGVYVASNSGNMSKIAQAAIQLLRGEDYVAPKERPVIELEASDLEPLIGKYELQPGVILTVTRDGNELFAQLTGQDRFGVFPSAPLEFFFRVVEATLTFEKNEEGEIHRVVLKQGGAVMPLKKIE